MISKTLVCLENKEEIRIDWTLIKKLLKILSLLLIIFTLIFFTFFGCFLVLNNFTSWTAQTVTLSSEGAAYEMYPDSMGEYQLAEEEIEIGGVGGSLTIYNWYRHKNRKDRFLMYNINGKIENNICNLYFTPIQNIVGTSPGPIRQRI